MVQDPVSQKYGNETRKPGACYLLIMLLQSYCDAEWVDIKYLSILQMATCSSNRYLFHNDMNLS